MKRIIAVLMIWMLVACKPDFSIPDYIDTFAGDYAYELDTTTDKDGFVTATIDSEFFCSEDHEALFEELAFLMWHYERPDDLIAIHGRCDDVLVVAEDTNYYTQTLTIGTSVFDIDGLPTPTELGTWVETNHGDFDAAAQAAAATHFAIAEDDVTKLWNDYISE